MFVTTSNTTRCQEAENHSLIVRLFIDAVSASETTLKDDRECQEFKWWLSRSVS
jgi:hypothetical protein